MDKFMELNEYEMYGELKNSVVMITGATGLIGKALVKRLLKIDAKVLAVVRDIDKAYSIFGNDDRIKYIVSDVTQLGSEISNIDYIIHAASNTSSKAFVSDPIGVINTAVVGTENLLEIARKNNVKSFVYLSSMEVYGTPTTNDKITEQYASNLNTMVARSAYPESKRMCESICASYVSQYGVRAKVVRLTQTFGPGVQYDDDRVFAEFARCVIENRNIILHTKGETRRNYLYTEDAVDAILTVLLNGLVGEAYNAANEDSYCSILEMAQLVARECSDGQIKVIIEEIDTSLFGYAPTLFMNLDAGKLRKLGWKPQKELIDMFNLMINDMRCNKDKETKKK